MKKTLITLVSSLVLVGVLSACGGATTQTPAGPAAPTGKPDYRPYGPTIHFHRIADGNPAVEGEQPTVGVSFSGFETDDPNVVTPISVHITGQKDRSTEGIDFSLNWDLVEQYRPELYADYDRLCSYQLNATIGGEPAITQHYDVDDVNSCWVEFVLTGE